MKLTKRESEILGHLYTFKSQNEISEVMGCSTSNVKELCTKLYKKMKVQDRVHLMSERILVLENKC